MQQVPAGIAHGADVLADPFHAAIATAHLRLEIGDIIPLPEFEEKFLAPARTDIERFRAIFRPGQELRRCRTAENAGQGRINADETALRRRLEHPLHRALKKVAIAGFARPDHLLSLLERRDVDDQAEHQPSAGALWRDGAAFMEPVRVVGFHNAELMLIARGAASEGGRLQARTSCESSGTLKFSFS